MQWRCARAMRWSRCCATGEGMPFRVLVLGGYGQFGRRIVAGLARDPGFELIVAGRDATKAATLADTMRTDGGASIEGVAVDVDRGFDQALSLLRPDLVIHTAGPFQQRDHAVARQALAHGAHYIDLADGRDFVEGFPALDAAARAAGRLAVTGASSVPGLSAAVIAALLPRFGALERVEAGISPGNRTDRGLATTRAILGYVGRPFTQWHAGRWRRVHGWQSLRRVRFAGVGARWFARCEVPDLGVLPARYPTLRDCDFRAGLELRRMHFGLWLASWGMRAGVLGNFARHAPALLAISERWRDLASDIGVMYVDLAGTDPGGAPLRLRWSLVARDGDGPRIPATPAIVLARKLARGECAATGATACLDLFTLEECLAALRDAAVSTSLETLP